jgi:alkylation response protein AidB-like acyl-CoA dehydrogenase
MKSFPSNVDAKAWTSAAELGWFALGLPEDFAGVGCGLADETLVFREIGRALASGPFLSTTLAHDSRFGGDAALAGGRRAAVVALGLLGDASRPGSGAAEVRFSSRRSGSDLVLVAAGRGLVVAVGDPSGCAVERIDPRADWVWDGIAPARCR